MMTAKRHWRGVFWERGHLAHVQLIVFSLCRVAQGRLACRYLAAREVATVEAWTLSLVYVRPCSYVWYGIVGFNVPIDTL